MVKKKGWEKGGGEQRKNKMRERRNSVVATASFGGGFRGQWQWMDLQAGNSSLHPLSLPSPSHPPLLWHAPLLTPSLCQFSCQNFVRILIFLLFSLSPFFLPLFFFLVFLCRVLWPGKRWNGGLPRGAGAGQVLWLGRRHSLWRLSATAWFASSSLWFLAKQFEYAWKVAKRLVATCLEGVVGGSWPCWV